MGAKLPVHWPAGRTIPTPTETQRTHRASPDSDLRIRVLEAWERGDDWFSERERKRAVRLCLNKSRFVIYIGLTTGSALPQFFRVRDWLGERGGDGTSARGQRNEERAVCSHQRSDLPKTHARACEHMEEHKAKGSPCKFV